MAVPKKKTTKSAKNQRRSHHALKKPILAKCSNCDKAVLPHHVCLNCGHYKGKQVIEIKTKEDKQLTKKGKDNTKKDSKIDSEQTEEDKSKSKLKMKDKKK